MIEEMNNHRNPTLIRYHPSCRLCHYAGFSSICTFSQTGRCSYNTPAEGSRITEVEQDD